MYPGQYAQARADQPAVVMAGSGEAISYRELEARSRQPAIACCLQPPDQ